MANFSLIDALNANFSPEVLGQMKGFTDAQKMQALGTIGFTDAGGGSVSVPDSILGSNMDSGGMFDWGDLIGPGMLIGAPFAGMMGAFGGGLGAAGAGAAGEAAALTGSGTYGGAGMWGGLGGSAGGLSGLNLPSGITGGGGGAGGALPYSDGIEGLIDLTNKGMTGEQAVQTLSQMNPAWTQSTLQFLGNNPSQLFGGQSGSSLASTLGKLGATALGMYGSNQQAKSLSDLAGQYQNFGAPSRARYEAAMTPGFDPMSIPGYSGALDTASKSILAGLSATGGNPFGQPGQLIDANKKIVAGTALPAIQNYTNQNASVGFGAPMSAALNLQTQGIGADANTLNALGYGLNSLTNSQPSLADLMKQIQGAGFKWNDGTGL